MTTHRIFAATHTGLVRRMNEDACAATGLFVPRLDGEVVSTVVSNGPCLAVVADGLGGHPCGEVASQLAVEYLIESELSDGRSLVAAVQGANVAIVAEMEHRDGSTGMGTTVAGVLVDGRHLAVVNVGDSAVFEMIDGRLEQLSTDDVPDGRSGVPGVPSSIVTQTLGGSGHLLEIEPHLYEAELASPCRLLLCTDGLTNFVPRTQIADSLRRYAGADAVTELISLALAAGAPDNVTVVMMEVGLDLPSEGSGCGLHPLRR